MGILITSFFTIGIIINFYLLYRSNSKIRIGLAVVTALVSLVFIVNIHFEWMEITKSGLLLSVIWYIISTWNIISVFFDKNLKKRLKIENIDLSKHHINEIVNFLAINNHTYRSNFLKNNDLIVEPFLEQNQKNLSKLIKLKNQKHNILSKLYEESYSQFSDVFLENIYLLRKEKRMLPSKIALFLGKAFDKKFEIQLNTSNYNLKDFYDQYSTENDMSNSSNTSKRIILIESKDNLDTSAKDKIEGLNFIFKSTEFISYFLWIYEWHKQNRDELYFVLRADANAILEQVNTNHIQNPVESLDFSINYDSTSIDEQLIIVNHINESTDINIGLVKEKTRGVKLEITNSPTYLECFNQLLNKAIDINSILTEHKTQYESIYKS